MEKSVSVAYVFTQRFSCQTMHTSTSFGWGEGGNITSAGWQVILCDPIWHVSSRSGEASCELLYSVYLLPLPLQLGHTQQLSKEIHANIGRFETGLWAFISIVVLNKCCMVPLECVEVL